LHPRKCPENQKEKKINPSRHKFRNRQDYTTQPPAEPEEIDYTADVTVEVAIQLDEIVHPLPEPKP
jgi:hypothetical protein